MVWTFALIIHELGVGISLMYEDISMKIFTLGKYAFITLLKQEKERKSTTKNRINKTTLLQYRLLRL